MNPCHCEACQIRREEDRAEIRQIMLNGGKKKHHNKKKDIENQLEEMEIDQELDNRELEDLLGDDSNELYDY